MRSYVVAALAATTLLSTTAAALATTSGRQVTAIDTVSVTMPAKCKVTSNGQLVFPNYLPSGVPFNSQSADIGHTYDAGSADAIMQCTANTAFTVTVAGSTHRTMIGSSSHALLPYTYNVLGTFSPRGTPPNVHCPLNNTTNSAGGTTDPDASPVDIQFAACIEPGLWPTPDVYHDDSFTFTVSF